MIGLRIGLAIGLREGAAIGIGADAITLPTGATTTQTIALADNSTSGAVITGGDAFAVTATYTNTGAATATTVAVAITLDANATYVSSSGTGWSFSGPTAHVLTATRATAAVGAAPTITVNLTSPTSATTLTTTAQATASNAGTANSNTDSITVNLVSKDATAGIYFPATSTEWSNFIARKGLAMSTPDALWLCQDASGNLADAIGSFTLTAGGTGLAYQQTVTGYSRKAITFTDGSTGNFITSSASLPNLSTQSMLTMMVVKVTTTPTVARQLLLQGGAGTTNALGVAATTGVLTATAGSTASGASNLNSGSVDVVSMETNRTATTVTATTRAQALGPTWNGSVAGQRVVIAGGSTPAMAMLYVANWHASKGEATDANLKALEQAMGFTITR